MVKTSSKKSRGIRGNVTKHVIRLGQKESNLDETPRCVIFSKGLQNVGQLAKAHWNFLLRTSTNWNLSPVEFDLKTGRSGLSTLRKRCVHYLLVSLYAILMIYRVHVTIQRVAAGKLDLFTYMFGCHVIISLLSSLTVAGSTCLSSPLCDLFKSWKSIQHISELHTRRSKTMFDDNATSTKVLFSTCLHLAAINASMFSLVGGVPTCILPTLTRMGWLELSDYAPRVMWSLVFLPLELLALWSPLLAWGAIGSFIILGLGAFKVFADGARKEKVDRIKYWNRVYRLRWIMHVCMYTYNVILLDWLSTMLMMGLVCSSCAVILLLYVTIRPSNLPWLIYVWFPLVAAVAMVTITWILYDCVIIKRTVADVEENLHLGLDTWRFRDIKNRRRTVFNRMLKSLPPASLRLGPFGEVTLDVTINVWDEVLNQLLFLLSF